MDFMQAGVMFFVAGTVAFAIYIYEFIMAQYASYKIGKAMQDHDEDCEECKLEAIKKIMEDEDARS